MTIRPVLALVLAFSASALAEPPGEVRVTPDIVYATYGTRQLKLDVYRPPSTKPLPGIVVIRGGGWRVGDKQGFAKIAQNLAAQGFVTACIEYRVIPEAQFIDEIYDAKAAVRWMRAEGKQYGIATDRIGAIGGSAAGHLVEFLASTDKLAKFEGQGGHAGVSSRVQAVVSMAGVSDLTSSPVLQTIFKGDRETAASFSPVNYVSKDSAPVLFLHGDQDKTVPLPQSQVLLERYQKAGARASLVTYEGAPHGFWHQDKWSADTIAQAARFFHDVLGN
jgi:pectinesterase